MEYGLIGEKLGHSYSPEIHRLLGDYEYELREIPKKQLGAFMKATAFKAINVTIPYKQDVIPYLDVVDGPASEIGAVNTIVNRDGRLYGFNTDFAGMTGLLNYLELDLKGRKVLVFPDIDAYAAWREAFAKKPFLSVTFSDILEKEGTPEDRAAQIDIADWLLQWQGNCRVPSVPFVPERNTAQPEGTNPVLAEVARYFSPESLPEVAALIEDLDLEIISIIPPENV